MKYNEKEIDEANKIHSLQIRCNELMKENARIKAELAKEENNECGFCRENDLFECVRRTLGCMYVSDIRCSEYKEKAIIYMASNDLSGYSIETLEDMAGYLFGGRPRFYTREQAYECFETYERKIRKEHR